MTTAASAAGTAPAPASEPAAPTAAQLASDLPKFSADDLDRLLEAPPAAPAAPAAPDAPAAPATPAPATAAPETKTEDEEEHGEDDATPKSIKIKPADFKEQEVLRLMKPRDGKAGLSMQEAYRRVYGNETAKPADEPAKPEDTPNDPAAAINKEIETETAKLTDLEAKIQKASEDMDLATVTKLTREAVRIEQAIERLKDKATQAVQSVEEQAKQSFRQQQANYTKQAVDLFPSLKDAGNADRKAFDAFIAEKYQDPEYSAIFESPRWPLVMAKEFAEVKGWTPARKSTAAAPASPATPAPQQPVASAARATAASVIAPGAPEGSTFTPTKQELTANLDKYSAKDLDAMLGKV